MSIFATNVGTRLCHEDHSRRRSWSGNGTDIQADDPIVPIGVAAKDDP